MDNRPVGVFDSGLGGLTAARKIRSILPSEDIIYFGDTSRVPYGGRTPGDSAQVRAAGRPLPADSFDIKAIVVACGTVSTTCSAAAAGGERPAHAGRGGALPAGRAVAVPRDKRPCRPDRHGGLRPLRRRMSGPSARRWTRTSP